MFVHIVSFISSDYHKVSSLCEALYIFGIFCGPLNGQKKKIIRSQVNVNKFAINLVGPAELVEMELASINIMNQGTIFLYGKFNPSTVLNKLDNQLFQNKQKPISFNSIKGSKFPLPGTMLLQIKPKTQVLTQNFLISS